MPSTESALSLLRESLADGKLQHGSNMLNLCVLKPGMSTLHIPTDAGMRLERRNVVCATDIAELAIFYGAIKAVLLAAGVVRGSAVHLVRNDCGDVVDYRLFVSDRGKQIVRERESQGGLSAVYFLARDGLSPNSDQHEWTSDNEVPVLGSVAVTSRHLEHNIFNLPPPGNNPSSLAYYEMIGAPPETPPI